MQLWSHLNIRPRETNAGWLANCATLEFEFKLFFTSSPSLSHFQYRIISTIKHWHTVRSCFFFLGRGGGGGVKDWMSRQIAMHPGRIVTDGLRSSSWCSCERSFGQTNKRSKTLNDLPLSLILFLWLPPSHKNQDQKPWNKKIKIIYNNSNPKHTFIDMWW